MIFYVKITDLNVSTPQEKIFQGDNIGRETPVMGRQANYSGQKQPNAEENNAPQKGNIQLSQGNNNNAQTETGKNSNCC